MNNLKELYESKLENYYATARTEILPLLPAKADNVLDIGCGQGKTLQWLKTVCKCKNTFGVELNSYEAEKARNIADIIIQGDIEKITLPFNPGYFDIILCLDVLEHLINPWDIVKKLSNLIKSGGYLISSVPNVKHYSVILPLLLKGQWKYVPSGILDITHLRFFTRKSAISLVEIGGLKVDMFCSLIGKNKTSKSRIANTLSFGIFKAFLESHYLSRAKKLSPTSSFMKKIREI